jgi:hypothetical protein
MSQKNKMTRTERKIQRILFFRRTAIGLGVIVFFLLLAFGCGIMWQYFYEPPFVPPSYEKLDPESPDYWVDRIMIDVNSVRSKATELKKSDTKLYFSVMGTLNAARKCSSQYERLKAVSDIALTLAKNDIDINVDNIVLELGDSPPASAIRARILISQGLMYLRLSKRSAAKVALLTYDRLVIDADLKLNSTSNEYALLGAVTILAYLKDLGKLNEILNRQCEFALRMTTEQRMRTYRIIAGEQARAGMTADALNSAQKIQDTVERVRAYQMILFYTARAREIKPEEPAFVLPPTEGPWKPLTAPAVARQTVADILKQILACPSLEEQIDLLTMLSGSRLMCDAEIHRLLRESVAGQPNINESVKQLVLQHLDNPRSELIRASLKLPPLPKTPRHRIDTAAEDWNSPVKMPNIENSELNPNLTNELADQQMIWHWLMTAQCYQMVERYSDSTRSLRQAAAVAKKQRPAEQFQNLLKIGERLLSAGSISEAGDIFRNIKMPAGQTVDSVPENQYQLSDLARLQMVGRFFDDALKTINRIEPATARDNDLTFLVTEQIRISRFEEAADTALLLTDTSQKERLQHLLAIAKGAGKEHYNALKIPFPDDSHNDTELIRCGEFLTANNLLGIAVQTAQKIGHSEQKSKLLARIVREYVLLLRAYEDDSQWQRSVRDALLNNACSAAEKITDLSLRAYAQEAMIDAALPLAAKEKRTVFLLRLFDETWTACRQISIPANKAELMGRLILAKIMLEADGQTVPNRFPLLNPAAKSTAVNHIVTLIAEAVEAVNETDGVPQRGYALSNLAKAMGQIGRAQGAQKLLENAEETAKMLNDKHETISIMLSLIPTFQALNDIEGTQKIYRQTFTIVANSFIEMPNTTEATLEWRQRDSELDRIIRSLLEQNFIAEGITFANRVNDPLLRDRLLRVAVYIYMDEGDIGLAESTVRKIELPAVLDGALRDVQFMKRRLTNKPNDNKSKNQANTGKSE